MNAVKWIYPLALRQRVAYRWVAASGRWPSGGGSYDLELAPASLVRLLPTDTAHRSIAWLGFYELGLSRRIAKLARHPGGLFVDVGANVGYFSVLWTALSESNRCLAYEASPTVFTMLCENVCAAGLASRLETVNCAIGRAAGCADFDPGPGDQTGWGGIVSTGSTRCYSVRVERLDDMVPMNCIVEVLKIDVEGAETWVLEGADQLLSDFRVRRIFFECNRPRMSQLGIGPSAPVQLLESKGYTVRPLHGDAGGNEFVACAPGVDGPAED